MATNIIFICLAAFVVLAGLATMALGIVEAVRGKRRIGGALVMLAGAVVAAIAAASLTSLVENTMYFENHEESGVVEEYGETTDTPSDDAAHMSDERTSAPDDKD